MSGAIEQLRAASAAAAEAQATLNEARRRFRDHEYQTRDYEQRLSALERELQAYHTAQALGEDAPAPPDAAEMDNLRGQVAVAPSVAETLDRRVRAAKAAAESADTIREKAIHHYLCETAVEPARAELKAALEQVRAASVKLMAAHNVAYHEFRERSYVNSSLDYYGPAARLMNAFHRMRYGGDPDSQWCEVEYGIQPDWLMWNSFEARKFPGVVEHAASLRADVEREVAA